MSVARCREINARLRAAGITVHEWPGWEARGNGQSSAYEGGIVHHTASPYGMTYRGLVDGRPDLAGPLANYGGNEDGSLTIVAAHPANHAGASGGRSMGPLPRTNLFNKRVMGLEIVYPGVSPMRPAQYRTACAWARAVADVVGGGDIQRIRAHGEVSVTGKWDPGYANGRTIDMSNFRADASRGLQIAMEDELNWNEPLKHPVSGWSEPASSWITMTNGEVVQAKNAAFRIEAQLAKMEGALTQSQAALLAAVREDQPVSAVIPEEQLERIITAVREAQTEEEATAAIDELWRRIAPKAT